MPSETDKLYAKIIHKFLAKIFLVRERIQPFKPVSELISVDRISSNLNFSEIENEDVFYLKPEYEDEVFQALFQYEPSEKLYHYTSLEAAFSIIHSKKLQLSSIAGMNDKSETNFVDSLLGKEFENPLNSRRIKAFNRRYILCFSGIYDHFNQWRLYGKDGKGACLTFEFQKPISEKFYFVLGKVIYGTTLTNLLKELYNELAAKNCNFSFRRLFLWKNFLKHEDYQYENETRLLLYNKQTEEFKMKQKDFKLNSFGLLVPYVVFDLFDKVLPIKLTEITIGFKCPEKELNEAQFKYYVSYKNEVDSFPKIKVSSSKRDHYR